MSEVQDPPDIEKLPLTTDEVPVRETVREVFLNPINGTPDNISKAGCLALALKSNEVGGKDQGYVVWNAWREAFPLLENGAFTGFRNYIDFSDFSELNLPNGLRINFSNFEFREEAVFRRSRWGDKANFRGTIWGDRVQNHQPRRLVPHRIGLTQPLQTQINFLISFHFKKRHP